MARIRTIKPEIWTSEQFSDCSTTSRLLFLGLLSFCDDGGVHPASAKRLKMEVFPGDPFTPEEIEGWVAELIAVGLVAEFESQSQAYWWVTGFSKHQKVEKPTYRFPQPIGDPSSNGWRMVGERLPPESSLRESNQTDPDHLHSKNEAPIDPLTLALAHFGKPPFPPPAAMAEKDRRTILAVSILLAAGRLSEHAVADSVAAVRESKAPKRNPVSYFLKCLGEHVGGGKRLAELTAGVAVSPATMTMWMNGGEE